MANLKKRRGFTLIELMIIVVIIGILAALAIPRFMTASDKAKQREAKIILKQIYSGQIEYRRVNSVYGDNGQTSVKGTDGVFPQCGVTIPAVAKYTYKIEASEVKFTATATANLDDDVTIDTWTIDQNGILNHLVDDIIQ